MFIFRVLTTKCLSQDKQFNQQASILVISVEIIVSFLGFVVSFILFSPSNDRCPRFHFIF
jgi:hypothetical protein